MDYKKYLHFKVEGISFAIPVEVVQEIMPVPEITSIPNLNKQYAGVVNIRGKVIPALDLKESFLLCKTEPPKKLIVVTTNSNGNSNSCALLVDEVVGIIVADDKEVVKDSALNLFLGDKRILGILNKEQIIALLNVEKNFLG